MCTFKMWECIFIFLVVSLTKYIKSRSLLSAGTPVFTLLLPDVVFLISILVGVVANHCKIALHCTFNEDSLFCRIHTRRYCILNLVLVLHWGYISLRNHCHCNRNGPKKN